jgi:hypothetical protein
VPINAKYLFVASMDVDAEQEALFYEVYEGDNKHPTENLRQGTGR